METGTGTADGLLFPVSLYPGFPTLACGGVAAGKDEGGDIRIGDFQASATVFGQNANKRGLQRAASDAIEDVTFKLGAVLFCQGDVAAIVECFFEGLAKFGFGATSS